MKIQNIEYHADEQRMIGYFAVDETKSGKRPGIIIAHEGGGLSEHAKSAARRLADLGYAAFALDYYGDGGGLPDMSVGMKRIGQWLADPTGIRIRAHAALEVLTSQPETDPKRVAGIGYCFGGTTVLEMARAGEPLVAVVGFHSGLGTARPAPVGLKTKVLVQIGADDPIIPPEQRTAFEAEMTAAAADWRMIVYGGAGHSFTNPDSTALNMPGFAYNESADKRSWRAMLDLFDEVL